MLKHIQVFEPSINERDISALEGVLRSNWIGRGKVTIEFEEAFAKHLCVNAGNVMTMNSCTEALFQICELLSSPGGEVVLPSNSFVGAANAVMAAGMRPVFCDVSESTGNVRLVDVEAAASERTVAVLVQHWGGFACEIEKLATWTRERGVALVEDAAGAVATNVNGTPCGTWGDFGVWSLDAMKLIVAGDGGVVWSRSSRHREQLVNSSYLGLGVTSGMAASATRDRWWEFDVTMPGRRSIMNDLSAALGLSQLNRISSLLEVRRRNSIQYADGLSNLGALELWSMAESEANRLSHYFFPIRVIDGRRDALAQHLRSAGVYTTFRYYPLHKVSLYGHLGGLPGTEKFSSEVLLLPQHANLSESDVAVVIDTVRSFMDT